MLGLWLCNSVDNIRSKKKYGWYVTHNCFRSCWLCHINKLKLFITKSLAKSPVINQGIFYYLIVSSCWDLYRAVELRKIASLLNSLCTSRELRPAPAALPFDVVCPGDLADQGVVILASLAQVFTEKLTRQNWK